MFNFRSGSFRLARRGAKPTGSVLSAHQQIVVRCLMASALRSGAGGCLFFRGWYAVFDTGDDFLIYAAGRHLFSDTDCVADCQGVRAAVTDQAVSADAQQRRTAVFAPVVLLV